MVFGRKKKKKKVLYTLGTEQEIAQANNYRKKPTQKEKSKGRIEEINKERSVRHT